MIQDGFRLSSGNIYICEEGKQPVEIGAVNDVQIDLGDPGEECVSETTRDFIHALSNIEASFECTAQITEEFIMEILGFKTAILNACKNRRVVYLAGHAKKKRTRKKNFHRAVKILERG